MKKTSRKQIKDYIEKVWKEICQTVFRVKFQQIRYEDDDTNDTNGWCSISYNNESYYADLLIFKSIFEEEAPDEGLTSGFKMFIKMGLCHEAGHLYIWELEGTKGNIEKISSQIGMLILEILDYRNI